MAPSVQGGERDKLTKHMLGLKHIFKKLNDNQMITMIINHDMT